MDKITEKEMMELLGYDDPIHSYAWYREHYPELPQQIKEFIIRQIQAYKAFPKEIVGMDSKKKCLKYSYMIEIERNSFVLRKNNVDRAEVSKEEYFSDVSKAAEALIECSAGIGGSLKSYWNKTV